MWSRGSSVCQAWCTPSWLLSPGVSTSTVSTDSSQTRAPRPVWARARRELGQLHLSVRPSVQPALTQFTKGHESTPRPQVCPHPRILCSLRAQGCSEEPCRPPHPIPGLPCTGACGCSQPAKRPCSRLELSLGGGGLRVCGAGPLVSLARLCPSSHWSGFQLLEKAVSGECRVSLKLLVVRVLGARLRSSSVAHVCPGSYAHRTRRVCGLWGRGALWLFRVYSGQAVLRGHGSPGPSRAPCFGGALGGAWRPQGVGGVGALGAAGGWGRGRSGCSLADGLLEEEWGWKSALQRGQHGRAGCRRCVPAPHPILSADRPHP